MTETKTTIRWLTKDQAEQLLDSPHRLEERDFLILLSMLETGMRRQETADLRFADLLRDKIVVRLQATGAQPREVPVHPVLFERLVSYGRGQRLEGVDRLFGLKSGSAISDVVKKYAHRAGLPKWVNPSALRNGFAVAAIQEGRDIRTVQLDLGLSRLDQAERFLAIAIPSRKDVHTERPLPWTTRLLPVPMPTGHPADS